MRTAFAFCFLGLLAILGGAAVFSGFAKYQKVRRLKEVLAANAPIVTSFKRLYPFEDEPTTVAHEWHGIEGAGIQEKWTAALQSYLNLSKSWTGGINRHTRGHNVLFSTFRWIVGIYDGIVGDRIETSDDIIRLDNGYYTYLFPYNDSANTWTNIGDFAVWLKERNICCLHLLPPYKFDDRVTVFPKGIPHGYGRMVREYRQFMSDNSIPCLDAGESLLAENSNFYEWFYKTYFHYTAQAGLAIARMTARMLNDELGVTADSEALKEENFTRCVYPKLYHANCAVGCDADGEDFEALYPRKGGCFHVEVPSMGLSRTGEFCETLVLQTALESAARSHEAFFYGSVPLVRVENLTCTNSTRVLVVRRCDANVVCPYLACAVRHLDVIYSAAFDGSIRTFIEKTKPDVVIFCTYMQTYVEEPFWRLK